MFRVKLPEILLTGEKGVGKSTILNLFPGENILEIDLNLNEIIKKPIKIENLKGINKCILRDIDLNELTRNLISYRHLLESIDIICIITDSTKTNLESTQQSYLELKKNLQYPDYYFIANFQDIKKIALEAEKIEELFGVKTYGFSAVQKDSREELSTIIEDILKLSIIQKEETDVIQPKQVPNDIKIVILKESYSNLWSEVEEAAILGKRGDHILAAKRFSKVASQLKEYNTETVLKEEREKIGVLNNLCKAWESMELAEEYNEPKKYSEAVNFFIEASNLTNDNKLRLFIIGNKKFCKALQLGLEFDMLDDINFKSNNYHEIKTLIKESADLFKDAGFEIEAKWVLATASYFKATWYLMKADAEQNFNEKKKMLNQVSDLFRCAAKLFREAGYKEKEKEVLDQLNLNREK